MKTISLCMIVKNEEKVLNRCLKSVKDLVDEVIIVDTGSTDKTKLIAKKYTNNIYDFEWCNDFSKARNYAISKATCNYIMWLDADDVVPANTIKSLLNLKSNMTADIYMLKYDIAFVNNKSTFSYFRERIIKNCSLCKFKGVVHECITPFGKVEKINLSIKHKKINNTKINRNLQIYEQLKKQKQLSAREQYYYARELFDNKKYSQCIKELKVFVKSKDAWTENIIDAYYLMSICYNIKNNKKEIDCLLKTFLYDKPRANICCKIGDVFLKNKNYTVAIYWYNLATQCKSVINQGGFVEDIYYNYYPYLQLCVCYYKINQIEKSNYYNEKAGKYYRSDIVKNNREFFKQILIKK